MVDLGHSNNTHVLPDSRARNETYESVMCDWPLPGGGTVRLEAVKIYCASCHCPYGWVPNDNTVFVCWLCQECSDKYGDLAGTYKVPDEDFCEAVAAEMEARFGRLLTEEEIISYAQRGELGRALELLERESPYPVPTHVG